MVEGKVVDEFEVKGKEGEKLRVVFRYPSMGDVEAAMRMVNFIRDEAEYLGRRHHETMETEKRFIEQQIENIKKRKGVFLFVEVNGEFVGDASIQPLQFDVSEHVGDFGIFLKERFTGLGIGTRLMQKMIDLAGKETRFSVLDSGYNAKNARSAKLHKKFGFRQYG